MPSPTPIRTELFRFVTLRTPQLIQRAKRDAFYVFHPSPSKSHFLKGIASASSITAARETIARLTGTFKSVRTFSELRDAFSDLHEFSSWLMANRGRLTVEEVKTRAPRASVPAATELIDIWDNLLYQLATRQSAHARQACAQMIITAHFLEQLKPRIVEDAARELSETPRFPDAASAAQRELRFVRRLARSRVVIPKAFSVDRAGARETEAPSTGTDRRLRAAHESAVAATDLRTLVTVTDDLRRARAPQANASEARSREPVRVSELKKATAPFSPRTAAFVKSLPASATTVDDITAELASRVRRKQGASRAAPGHARRTIVSRGIVIPMREDDRHRFVASVSDDPLAGIADAPPSAGVFLSVNPGADAATISGASFALVNGDRSFRTSRAQVVGRSDEYLHLSLFTDDKLELNSRAKSRLTGELSLDDGTTLAFDGELAPGETLLRGTAIPRAASPPGTALPAPAAPPSGSVELYGVNNIGIGVLRKVEQEVCCYVPGEVSRIENILAREYKERHTRSLQSSESTDETTTEVESENLTDTATTTRNDMQTEVATVLAQDSSMDVGGSLGVSGQMWGATVTADAYLDTSSSTSSSRSDTVAKTYAEEITSRALERVVQKSTVKRTTRMLEEYEESNRHGFDNRAGDKHVTGIYRWVDVIYTNRLINYGKRLMYEFMVPEPAYYYKQALEKIAEEAGQAAGAVALEAPIPLEENGILDPATITEETYSGFARLYGITILPPPRPLSPITDGFAPPVSPDGKERTYDFELVIPSGYEATEADVDFDFTYAYGPTNKNTRFAVTVGRTTHHFPESQLEAEDKRQTGHGGFSPVFGTNFTTSVPVQVTCLNVFSFMVNVAATVIVQPTAMTEWQNAAYDQLARAYADQLAAYETALEEAAAESAKAEEDTSHGRFNRTVEKREIQRLCIEMLTSPFGIRVGRNFYEDGNCAPSLRLTRLLDTYSSHVKFFEQAFDWANMSYLFYPYYWARKCRWTSLMQSAFAVDNVFQAFLQSGMARVVVPVRPGFEDAVVHYMETGEIWNGGELVLESDDELYLSIAEELQEVEGMVEDEWQSRVPTTLTVVQADSVILEEEGLPCCSHVADGVHSTALAASSTILSGVR
jgi:hypothetical protein